MNQHGECRTEHFHPIEDYGVIGNMQTVALVSKRDASIDHFCFPHFDSPLVFGRLLTRKGGGYYQISPRECGSWTSKQVYLPSSNVLVTRYLVAGGGIGQITDFLPVTAIRQRPGGSVVDQLYRRELASHHPGGAEKVDFAQNELKIKKGAKSWPWVVRKVETIRGKIMFGLECQPAFDYGRQSHNVALSTDAAIFESSSNERLRLSCHRQCAQESNFNISWKVTQETIEHDRMDDEGQRAIYLPTVMCSFELGEDESILFLLRQPDDGEAEEPNVDFLQELLHSTNQYWHSWISKCMYRGRWREMVYRSALVLKLLTFAPTGAIVAAPTLSLPERVKGTKNWDYRFTWIRDAAFTVYAFLRIGFTEEAADFMTWIEQRCRELSDDDPVGLRLMYDIRGCHPTIPVVSKFADGAESVLAAEVVLTHWDGYKDSWPVRVGNLAAFQHQLDIYGELLDAVYLCDKWVRPISYDFWLIIKDRIIPLVLRRWTEPDHGIWESRGEPQHHVYSKVMSWVALDRVIRLARKRSLPAPLDEWIQVRDSIYESVMRSGWNDQIGAFTQYYGGTSLDASNLIMPLVFFIAPDDPRFLRTLERTLLPPKLGGLTVNHLVFRYHPEGEDPEGAFSICSFWLVEALARAGVRHPGLLEEARNMFEDIIGYANHLGLFSEEIGLDGSALGNFPQAFTHLSLISAAFNLDRALGP